MADSVTVYIGLGSNLESPVEQLQQAVEALMNIPDCELLAVSPFYSSPPMGPQDQPDYVNAVAALQTTLSPEALLDQLQAIENEQGRVRLQRWGARTLDLDILLMGDAWINTARLTVPHPGLHLRSFVLYPLADISPSLHIPGRGNLAELLAQVPMEGLQRLDDVHGRSQR